MNEQVLQKLKVLAESAKYDVSCASSGTVRRNSKGGVGNTVGGWGICHSFAEEWETPSADGASAIASPKTDDASPC